MQVFKKKSLCTDLRWVAKPVRNSARKFTQVAKTRKFHAHTVDLRSTRVDLRYVAKRSKTCVDLRTNLTKVKASHRKWVAKRNASWTQVKNLC